MSQYKAVPRFTNKFPSDLLDAILSSSVKSINNALLFFGCVLFHILGTWSLPLIDRDEPRFAEASREMIERGNYIVPYFNNQLRLDKPPLTYWAQVASYRVFGENDFAARFPSAIAAALTALLIFVWGRRMGGEKLGWWAAIIFTLSLQTFVHAKAAVADMWLVLFVTLAHWAGYELLYRTRHKHRTANIQIVNNRRFLWWWIFYLSLALGFLAKGPIAWTPLLTVAVVIIYTRDWQLLRRFKFVGGILLTLFAVALWGIPALIQTHGEFFSIGIGRHVIGRSFTTTGRSRREFTRHVRAAIAVLFCHGLYQFLSMVDQVAVANSKTCGDRSRDQRLQRTIDLLLRASRSSSSSLLWSARSYRTTRCRRFRCLRFCSRGIGIKERQLKAAAPCSQPSRSQLRVCGSQLPSWSRQWWRGFSPRISSFKCLARLCSRTCNLLRSSSRSQVWSGIFAPASKVFSRR